MRRHRRRHPHYSHRSHGYRTGRDSEQKKPRKLSALNEFMKRVSALCKRHKRVFPGMEIVQAAWNKEAKQPKKNWQDIILKHAPNKPGIGSSNPGHSSSKKSSKKSGKKRRKSKGYGKLPKSLKGTTVKGLEGYVRGLIGSVKSAMNPVHRMRGSDYMRKHKVRLAQLVSDMDGAIEALQKKEKYEDETAAQKAATREQLKAARAAKAAAKQAHTVVSNHIKKEEGYRGVSFGSPADDTGNRYDGDPSGRPRKGKGKGKGSKGHKKSKATKAAIKKGLDAYWRKVRSGAVRRKGYKAGSKKRSAKKSAKKRSSRDFGRSRFY